MIVLDWKNTLNGRNLGLPLQLVWEQFTSLPATHLLKHRDTQETALYMNLYYWIISKNIK